MTTPGAVARPSVFFEPHRGFAGDIIPIQVDGTFFLFYLHEIRDDAMSGTAWGLVSTRDFVTFDDHGDVLPAGGPDAPDFNAYTGSVVIGDDGVAHLFYTGHNPRIVGPDGMTPLQVVMHATGSRDLTTWTKHPRLTFGAPAGYEPGDWRDPFVFRPGDGEPWQMLIAARHDTGPARRRGVVARMESDDLLQWRLSAPFWDPRRYVTHECPDVFRWGDWWYLVYSEFSESFTTRYRMARTPDGPWLVPPHDTVDGRAFYASKSVERDGRRFFVGWVATRAGEADDGPWEWAGTMSALEAAQHPDGTLAFDLPEEVRSSFSASVPVGLRGVTTGDPVANPQQVRLVSLDGYAAVVTDDELPDQFAASVEIDIAPGTRECGLLLRSSDDGDESYILRLEPHRDRVVLDRWPRKQTGPMQWQVSGDVPHAVELERPCDLAPGRHRVEVLVEGSICIAVIDRQVVLSARIYDRPAGRLGLFLGEGEAVFTDLVITERPGPTECITKEEQ